MTTKQAKQTIDNIYTFILIASILYASAQIDQCDNYSFLALIPVVLVGYALTQWIHKMNTK